MKITFRFCFKETWTFIYKNKLVILFYRINLFWLVKLYTICFIKPLHILFIKLNQNSSNSLSTCYMRIYTIFIFHRTWPAIYLCLFIYLFIFFDPVIGIVIDETKYPLIKIKLNVSRFLYNFFFQSLLLLLDIIWRKEIILSLTT